MSLTQENASPLTVCRGSAADRDVARIGHRQLGWGRMATEAEVMVAQRSWPGRKDRGHGAHDGEQVRGDPHQGCDVVGARQQMNASGSERVNDGERMGRRGRRRRRGREGKRREAREKTRDDEGERERGMRERWASDGREMGERWARDGRERQ